MYYRPWRKYSDVGFEVHFISHLMACKLFYTLLAKRVALTFTASYYMGKGVHAWYLDHLKGVFIRGGGFRENISLIAKDS